MAVGPFGSVVGDSAAPVCTAGARGTSEGAVPVPACASVRLCVWGPGVQGSDTFLVSVITPSLENTE